MFLRKDGALSLSSLISSLVLGTSALLTAAILLTMYQQSDTAARQSAETLFGEIASKTLARINVVVTAIETMTDMAALTFGDSATAVSQEALRQHLPALRFMLDANSQLLSAYLGFADGAFYQVLAPRQDARIAATYGAPAGTAYIDRTIVALADGSRRQTWRFLDADLAVLDSRVDAAVNFDPRQRPWYRDALQAGRSVFTEAYVFASSRLPGITCARVLRDGGGVFGLDVSLGQLGEMLARQQVSPGGTLWIVDAADALVARPGLSLADQAGDALKLPRADESDHPVVRAVTRATAGQGHGASSTPWLLDIDGETYVANRTTMPSDHGLKLGVVVAAPLADMTGHIGRMSLRILLLAAAILALVVPLAVLLARRVAAPVAALAAQAERIQRFDFSPSPAVRSPVREVQALARASEVMKAAIQTRTEGLIRTQAQLELLVAGGLALAAEKDTAKLVTAIFQTARALARADGGVVYLMEDEELGVELLALPGQSVMLGGLSDHPAPRVKVRPAILPLLHANSVLRPACLAFSQNRSVSLADVDLALFPTGLPEEPTGYRITACLSVPIVTRRDEVLGVIQLFNPGQGAPEVVAVAPGEGAAEGQTAEKDQLRDFIGSLAAQAAVTLDNRNLVNSLEALFDAVIQVIAASIDAKSPYTGGHCTRVPVLTEMLARAVHAAADGPMASFRLETDDAWRQLWIAAWLHDCGKVITPEYVVDKATKLETIYNRIHEVRMRFEVLRRDAEIAYLRQKGQGDAAGLEAAYAAELARLDEDFAFVARCNIGGEYLSEEARERLQAIARRTWLRHFSDRLGVSEEELRRKERSPQADLPTPEPLLADRPEHVIPRIRDYALIKDAQGNPLPVPEHEYNRGELYNLGIARGTLTPEERFKINEHTLSGLEMLKRIPFPRQLERVTDIATGHHETLIGTGYPLRKTKAQLPVEARIMAIADIFEALTASDRPYKKAKTLSESLKIMAFMRNDEHIDPDIFDVFLKDGVFQRYAEKYLDPAQCDVSDVSGFLSGPTSGTV